MSSNGSNLYVSKKNKSNNAKSTFQFESYKQALPSVVYLNIFSKHCIKTIIVKQFHQITVTFFRVPKVSTKSNIATLNLNHWPVQH